MPGNDRDLGDDELHDLIVRLSEELREATTQARYARAGVLSKRVNELMKEHRRRENGHGGRRVPKTDAEGAAILREKAYWDEIDRKRETFRHQLEEAEAKGIESRVETLRWEIERLPERPEETETERKARESHEKELRRIARLNPEGCDCMAKVAAQLDMAEFLREEADTQSVSTDICAEDLISCCGMSREQAEAAIENWGTDEDFHDDYFWKRSNEKPELPIEDQTDAWLGRHLAGWDTAERRQERMERLAGNRDDMILGNDDREVDGS